MGRCRGIDHVHLAVAVKLHDHDDDHVNVMHESCATTWIRVSRE
jgi:hypothetical protein